jgi:hypothetical protein
MSVYTRAVELESELEGILGRVRISESVPTLTSI